MLTKVGKKLVDLSGKPKLPPIRARFLLHEMRTYVRNRGYEISASSPLEMYLPETERALIAYLRAILRGDDVAESEGQLLKAVFDYSVRRLFYKIGAGIRAQQNGRHPELEDSALKIALDAFDGISKLFICKLGKQPRTCILGPAPKRRTACRFHTVIRRQIEQRLYDYLRQLYTRRPREISLTIPKEYEGSSLRDIPSTFDGRYLRIDNSARPRTASEQNNEEQAGVSEKYDSSEHAQITGTAVKPPFDAARKDAEIRAMTPFVVGEAAEWYRRILGKVKIKDQGLLRLLFSGLSVETIYRQIGPKHQTLDAFKMYVSRRIEEWDPPKVIGRTFSRATRKWELKLKREFNLPTVLEVVRGGSVDLMLEAIMNVAHPEQRENRRQSRLQIAEEIIRRERFYFPNADLSGLQERFEQRTAEAPTRCEHGVLTSWLTERNGRVERVVLTHVYCDMCRQVPARTLACAA